MIMSDEDSKPIDLRMRLPADGGPLFRLLSEIADAAARNERFRQLAYLGLMVERGSFFKAPANDPINTIKPKGKNK